MKEPEWYRKRRYLHFDLPIGPKKALAIASDSHAVGRHSFYPLIHSVLSSVKLVRDKITRRIKRERKDRPIAYAAHADSQIYTFYAALLNQLYEQKLTDLGLTDCVLAFRALHKGNIEFADSVFREIRHRKNCEVAVLDIKGFFDNLDHDLLKRAWQELLGVARLPKDHYAVFRSVTRWSYVEKKELFGALGISVYNSKAGHRKRVCDPKLFRDKVRQLVKSNSNSFGIPQGTPISAVLSNIYLLQFDAKMKACADSIGAKYFRYCDDMIVIAPPGQLSNIKAVLESGIAEAKLQFQHDKTTERVFAEKSGLVSANAPLQYLGFDFDGRNVRVRFPSIARYCDRLQRGIRVARKRCEKVNAVRAARNRPEKSLYLKKVYKRYSVLGRRNFMSYAYRAARIMNSRSIKRQLKPLIGKLKGALN